MSTPFYRTADNAATVTTGYTAGSGSIALAPGTGAAFATPTAEAPVCFSTFLADGTPKGVYSATGRGGDTLTGLTLLAGSDASLPAGSPVEIRWTAEHVGQITGAIDAAQDATTRLSSLWIDEIVYVSDDPTTTGYTAGSGSIVLAPGTGAYFDPTDSFKVRTFLPDGTPRGIYRCAPSTGDTLTGVVLVWGEDQDLPSGSFVVPFDKAANDRDVLHLGDTGAGTAETVYGAKTFDSPIVASGGVTLSAILADAAVPPNSLFRGGNAGGSLCWKNSAGVVTVLAS